jgi:hypothetical protein
MEAHQQRELDLLVHPGLWLVAPTAKLLQRDLQAGAVRSGPCHRRTMAMPQQVATGPAAAARSAVSTAARLRLSCQLVLWA